MFSNLRRDEIVMKKSLNGPISRHRLTKIQNLVRRGTVTRHFHYQQKSDLKEPNPWILKTDSNFQISNSSISLSKHQSHPLLLHLMNSIHFPFKEETHG
jgi:hypothetical protein